MIIRKLELDELNITLFDHFNRYQKVEKCRSKVDGKWTTVDRPFIDDWSKEDYLFLIQCLRNTLEKSGVVFAAFIDNKLRGFASVEGRLIGSHGQYMDLTSLHVSYDVRGKGIGSALFNQASDWAKARGAEKLYISSHSAIESQAFYSAMGCIEAREYNEDHVESEPCDCQLEFVL